MSEYRWTGLLMAAVGAVTSPFILSVVTDLVPWLQIVSRGCTAALCFSPANGEKQNKNMLLECQVDNVQCLCVYGGSILLGH